MHCLKSLRSSSKYENEQNQGSLSEGLSNWLKLSDLLEMLTVKQGMCE